MQTQHMEVFFLNQVHMLALSTAAWYAQSWEEDLGLSVQQKWLFWHWYLMEEEEPCTTAILRAPSHVEAIISNGVLRQFPYSKRNHWTSYPSLSPPSLPLLLAQACCSAPSPCPQSLTLIIISFSAAMPSSRSYFKFQDKKFPCGAV